jgi:hypothetical protein
MGIVQLPGVRGRGDGERSALRRGLATGEPVHLVPVRLKGSAGSAAYCAGCAGPIEFGAVARGAQAYCSIECSLGGDHTA